MSALVAAAEGGASCIHLRELDLPAGRLFDLTRDLRAKLPARTALIVNDRFDVALAAGADGVQLGEQSLPAEPVRRLAPPGFLIGRSIHDSESTIEQGADYFLVGTVFPSGSHPGGPTGGLDLVRAAVVRSSVPVIAIGGISSDNIGEVLAEGAAGVAVISAVLGVPDPRSAARALAGRFEGAK